MNLPLSTTLNQPMIWNPKLKGINSTANMLAKILTYVSQFFHCMWKWRIINSFISHLPSRRSVTPRDLSNTGSPAGFPKTRANKPGGMLRIKSAMLSLCLCECGPHSPIATLTHFSFYFLIRNRNWHLFTTVFINTKCFDKSESTRTDSNYVWIFWIWVWKDWVWKVHGYNCIRNKQSFLSHYSNIFQFCPSDCFLCCQSLHGVVQNENHFSEKDVLTLLPTYSPKSDIINPCFFEWH